MITSKSSSHLILALPTQNIQPSESACLLEHSKKDAIVYT